MPNAKAVVERIINWAEYGLSYVAGETMVLRALGKYPDLSVGI